jgi:hypothetical protein
METVPQRLSSNTNVLIAIALSLVLAGTVWVYLPGLGGGFVFDDLHNIQDNADLAIPDLSLASLERAALSRKSGISSRPLSMLSFAINEYLSGFNSIAYKAVNLFIHALNGLLLYFLTRLILTAYAARYTTVLTATHVRILGVAVSAAWLMHPANLTGVLYVVQRMNGLGAFFTVLGLVFYMKGRLRMERAGQGMIMIITTFAICIPVAILCKENGALLPLYAFVLELILFGLHSTHPRGRVFLWGTFGVFLALPLLGFLVYLFFHTDWLMNGYLNRGFTPGERLLTEARVLWFYLFITLVPDIRNMGLYHDDFAVSHGFFQPFATAPAVTGLIMLLIVAMVCRRRAPLVTLGVLFFFAGQSMESTILPLELIHEHRNYLPMYGVLLPLFYYLGHPALKWNRYRLRHAAAGMLILAFAAATTVRASQWGTPLRFNQTEEAHHPKSPRANYGLGREYFTYIEHGAPNREENFRLARQYFARSTLADGNFTNGLFGMITLYEEVNLPIPPGIVDMLTTRLKHAPFANNTGNMLAQLVTCQEDKICHLGRSDMQRLFAAALRNKTLRGVNKGSVLTSASRYFALLNDYPVTLRLAQQAVKAAPGELQYRLNEAYWLISMGMLDAAQKILDEARVEDTLGRHAQYIAEQEQRMKDARLVRQLSTGK